ncbi:MAG: hypothetical protein II075_11315 [Bacteroidales bacterium]|nr:hypothetical protein [Bacteroidales bacterium]
MINKPIETYKDIRRAQQTYKLASYYPGMDNGTLNFIFDFIENGSNMVVGGHDKITFYVLKKLVKTIPMKMDDAQARYIKDVSLFSGVINYTYMPSAKSKSSSGSSYTSYTSSSTSSYSSGGGSSNNNN